MEFSIKAGSPEKLKTDCVIIGVYADKKFTPTGNLVDALAHGALSRAIKRGDASGKRGATTLLHGIPGLQAQRVLLVGLGPSDELNEKGYAEAVRAAFKALDNAGARDVLFCLAEAGVAGRTAGANIQHAVVAARETAYRFDTFKSKKDDAPRVERIVFPVDKSQARTVADDAARGTALANGIDLTKTLGNLPANVCTPAYLADSARKLARDYRLDITVLERKQMQALKMGALLAVTQGSVQPPQFIVLEYHGSSAREAPVVLVGKGITFDTGGISLKPGEAMDEMKYDMCGAASVLGTLRAIAEMKLAINVVGIIPTCENMPAGNAVKPGDIVTSMSGQTIEILNTDAEGRLILCDALTYAERFKPAAVVDIATLTGACIIALGHVNSGLFSPHDDLLRELFAAGQAASDPAWPLPLDEAYQEQLKSNFADMANIGGRPAGSITAASFLARFTKRYKWAHLDIAGTAWKSGAAKGATGRPVPLLVEFLKNRAA